MSSAKTVGAQNIGFTGGGTLDLVKLKTFFDEMSGFAAGDAIDLLGDWTFSSCSENVGETMGTLTLASGAAKHAFTFAGDYAQSDFNIASGTTTIITHA